MDASSTASVSSMNGPGWMQHRVSHQHRTSTTSLWTDKLTLSCTDEICGPLRGFSNGIGRAELRRCVLMCRMGKSEKEAASPRSYRR